MVRGSAQGPREVGAHAADALGMEQGLSLSCSLLRGRWGVHGAFRGGAVARSGIVLPACRESTDNKGRLRLHTGDHTETQVPTQ